MEKLRALLLFLAALAAAGRVAAATFTVINTNADGPGSLYAAIDDANTAPGKDTIAFAIPGSGPHTIDLGGAFLLHEIIGPVDLDGTTQPGYVSTPLIVLRGGHNLASEGLVLSGGNSTVRGLSVTRWGVGIHLSSDDNAIENCYIGADETGEDPMLSKLDDNLVGIRISKQSGTVRNSRISGNLISANGTGIHVLSSGATQILGNLVGTNGAGTTVLANSIGILVADSTQVAIGDAIGTGRNVISGNGFGISITGASNATQIQGNFIGPNAAGTGPVLRTNGAIPAEVGNFFDGVLINVPPGNSVLIGGLPGQGNVIAFNRRDGVRVQSGAGIAIRGNSIRSNTAVPSTNTALGINLGTDAVTANDPGDGDAGANGLQNYPVLAFAASGAGRTAVQGALASTASTAFTIHLYSNAVCDVSGFGEGEVYLGARVVTTDAAGGASISAVLPVEVVPGQFLTATATDPVGNTSEFSACQVVSGPTVLPVGLALDLAASATSDGNGVFDPGETVSVAPVWNNVSTGSADLTANASAFGGPPGPTYSIPDSSADYGTLVAGATHSCSTTPDCYGMSIALPAVRPATHWDAQFIESPSTGDTPMLWTLHVGASFSDVLHGPTGNPFYAKIEALFHSGVTAGCTLTTYCPSQAVKRDQMSIFIAKALAGGGASIPTFGTANGKPYNCTAGGSSVYTDVAPTDIHCKQAHFLAALGVTQGCSATAFCGASNVNRSDMAGFMARALVAPGGGPAVPIAYADPTTGLSYSCDAASPALHFSDVPSSDPFCKHIHYLWARGIISGCSTTEYCGSADVTRDAMAKFLVNAFALLLSGP